MSNQIDSLANSNRLRLLPPSHKAGFATILLLLALVSPPSVQLLISLWLVRWIVKHAGIPPATYLPMLFLPMIFAITSMPAIVINVVGNDSFESVHSDIWWELSKSVAGWTIYISKLGLGQAIVLLTRSLAATSALLFLLLTTPINELILILRKLSIPPLLLDLMVYIYGFIFSLLTIVTEITIAQQARSGYTSWNRSIRSLALLIGQLLERSIANYRGLAMGLAARGFLGELRVISCVQYHSSRRLQVEAFSGLALLCILSICWTP